MSGWSTVGASAGAVDPKTRRKWVWAFIDAVANLVNTVVSLTYNVRMVRRVIVHRSEVPEPVAAKKIAQTTLPSMPRRELSIVFSTASSHPRRRRPLQTQIVFESRLGAHNVGNNCTMTIDGTDFRILQKGIAKKGNTFAPHIYAWKSALQYKLGVDIRTGNLVWIQGPYPTGKFTELKFLTRF